MIAGGAAEIGFADFKFLYHIQTNLMIGNSCFVFVLLRFLMSDDNLYHTDKEKPPKSKFYCMNLASHKCLSVFHICKVIYSDVRFLVVNTIDSTSKLFFLSDSVLFHISNNLSG